MKEVFAPHLSRNVKMGRKRPVANCPHPKLANYLRATVPPAPASADYTKAAGLPPILADIMGNDELGDCVCACGGHLEGVETANAGNPQHATLSQVIAQYSAIGGYVPGNPSTDQGCDEQTALNYWVQHGFPNGTKALGWLAVDATNKAEVQAALYLFENLIFGIELPDKWVSPFPEASGFTWDVAGAPDPENGHCVLGVGYDAHGVQIDSWGLIGTVTWAAVAEYASKGGSGELYVLITPDQLAKGAAKAPNGIAWSDLIADFDALGGKLPIPVAPPAPNPTPSPPAPSPAPVTLTLTQVEAWAIAALKTGPWLLSNTMAENAVKKSLAANWPKI